MRWIRTEVGDEQGRETALDWPSKKPLEREDIWAKLGHRDPQVQKPWGRSRFGHGCSTVSWGRMARRVSFISHRQNWASNLQARNVNVILNSSLSLIPRFTGAEIQVILLKPLRWVSSFPSLLPLFLVSFTWIWDSLSCLPLFSSHFNPVFEKLPEWSLEDIAQIQLKNPQWLPTATGWSPNLFTSLWKST